MKWSHSNDFKITIKIAYKMGKNTEVNNIFD